MYLLVEKGKKAAKGRPPASKSKGPGPGPGSGSGRGRGRKAKTVQPKIEPKIEPDFAEEDEKPAKKRKKTAISPPPRKKPPASLPPRKKPPASPSPPPRPPASPSPPPPPPPKSTDKGIYNLMINIFRRLKKINVHEIKYKINDCSNLTTLFRIYQK